MRKHIARQARTGRSGVAAIGTAQEFQWVATCTTREVRNGGAPHFGWIGRSGVCGVSRGAGNGAVTSPNPSRLTPSIALCGEVFAVGRAADPTSILATE
jgi:hypothetical protein